MYHESCVKRKGNWYSKMNASRFADTDGHLRSEQQGATIKTWSQLQALTL
jgi:hypothetical protein